jgi:tripartite-type tricarboxylate transporter receptor subunit TctC
MAVSWRIAIAWSVAALAPAGAAFAQDGYPNKVIRIVTSEPGSTNDLVARLVARGFSAGIGQTIIENRGGISPEVVARAAPDGYTILFFGNAAWIMPLFRRMPYDPQRDLMAVSTGCSQPTVLAVHPSLPVKNLKDLIALARARPGQINYGVGATIAGPTLAMEIFKHMTRVDMVKINYRGTGPAANALMAGEVQVMFVGAGSIMPQVRAGKLRALAVTTAEPTPLVPGVPTLAASGLPGYEYTSVIGFLAPAKTPPAIVNLLSREIVQILKNPDVNKQLFESGVEAFGTTPEKLAALMKADIEQWRQIIRDNGIQVEP